ncbi:MAG: hypothetical protein HN348_32480, partial [Proteobacteria bacterium]|nr:hypothetical protein [Pseudomonadota bacterium]
MYRRDLPVLALIALFVVGYWAFVPPVEPRPTLRPLPTEHWLDDGAEQRNKKARKEWFAERHKAV